MDRFAFTVKRLWKLERKWEFWNSYYWRQGRSFF